VPIIGDADALRLTSEFRGEPRVKGRDGRGPCRGRGSSYSVLSGDPTTPFAADERAMEGRGAHKSPLLPDELKGAHTKGAPFPRKPDRWGAAAGKVHSRLPPPLLPGPIFSRDNTKEKGEGGGAPTTKDPAPSPSTPQRRRNRSNRERGGWWPQSSLAGPFQRSSSPPRSPSAVR